MSTFKTGGTARYFCVAESSEDLKEATSFAKEKALPYFILGGGSNILFADSGYSGVVIRPDLRGIHFDYIEDGYVRVTASAGEGWDKLVKLTVDKGLYGLENLSSIPGTVGASPVQNIGAYGVEVEELIEAVEVYDVRDGKKKIFTNEECEFSYRSSLFKSKAGENLIVLRVVFQLRNIGTPYVEYKDLKEFFTKRKIVQPTLASVREAVMEIRSRKFPDLELVGTAGSFFKNPIISKAEAQTLAKKYPGIPGYPVDEDQVKMSAAWLIDNVAKKRGARRGNVGAYDRQALVFVNHGNARSIDVLEFAEEVWEVVYGATGIKLEAEVLFVGNFEEEK